MKSDTRVGTIIATDVEDKGISFSITGRLQAFFAIDPDSGALRFETEE